MNTVSIVLLDQITKLLLTQTNSNNAYTIKFSIQDILLSKRNKSRIKVHLLISTKEIFKGKLCVLFNEKQQKRCPK